MTDPPVVPVEPPVVSPSSLGEAYAAMAASPPARPLAGGTDLIVTMTGGLGEPPQRIVDLWRLDELRGIATDGDELTIGALTTFTEIRRSALCREHLPGLVQAAATIGAAQIQNRGTLGGNIATASPAGDSLPVLLALDAEIVVGGAHGERSIPASDFFPAYRRTALAGDELILRIVVPIRPDRTIAFRKVGTRRAQAISVVVLAVAWRAEDGAWRDVRVALGSVAATPIRARATEATLEGAAPTAEVAAVAAATLEAEITPIDDVRSTAEYRRSVAGRILHRIVRDAAGW